MFWFVLLI